MKYVQGHEHFDECARAQSMYAPCSCDVLRMQKTNSSVQVPVEFVVALEHADQLTAETVLQEAVLLKALDEEAPVAEAPEVGF